MKILITGICGFAGTAVAEALLERREGISISGIDNLHRPGSEINRVRLRKRGVKFIQGDIRQASDFEVLPAADWVIDAAANPSVLAGLPGNVSSRQLFEHNLASMVNVLEYCKAHRAGLLLLSSSRVYSIPGAQIAAAQAEQRRFLSGSLPPTCPWGFRRAVSGSISPRARPFPSTEPRNWPVKPSPWSTARRSTFPSGSTAAASWPVRDSSARRSREFSPIGSTPICASGLYAISASTAPASRYAMRSIRATWRRLLDLQMRQERKGGRGFTPPAAGRQMPCRWRN